MKKIRLILLFILPASIGLFAQQSINEDPIAKAFFPPELVIQNQQAIKLSETQRLSIQKEMQTAQSDFMSLQWGLQKEMERFKLLIGKEMPVEAEVSEQLDRMLAIENKIKKKQVVLLTRIKNLLSREQQEELRQIKDK